MDFAVYIICKTLAYNNELYITDIVIILFGADSSSNKESMKEQPEQTSNADVTRTDVLPEGK